MVKTLHDDLLLAQADIKKLKEEKGFLEHLLLKKVEEVVSLENKLKVMGNTAETSYSTALKKNMKNNRLSLPKTSSVPKTNSALAPQLESFILQSGKKQAQIKRQTKNNFQSSSFLSENRFDVLLQEDETNNTDFVEICEETSTMGKILLCADSHGKDLSWHLNKIDNSYDSIGFVTPGGRAEQVIKMDSINGEILSEKDFLVVMCGTNDVARNESSELMERMNELLKHVKNKQVIVIDLPNRYDLVDWSCVNLETKKTNLALKNLTEQYENVDLIEASRATREMHTRQGLHLNTRGKCWLAEKIKEVVNGKSNNGVTDVVDKQPPPPGADLSGNDLHFPQDHP